MARILNGYNKQLIGTIREIKKKYENTETFADEIYGAIQVANWMENDRMSYKSPIGIYKSHYPSTNGKYACSSKSSGLFYEAFASWKWYTIIVSLILVIVLPLLFLTSFRVVEISKGVEIFIIVLVCLLGCVFIGSLIYTIYRYIRPSDKEPQDSVYAVNAEISEAIGKSHKEIIERLPKQFVDDIIKKRKLKSPSYTETLGNYFYLNVMKRGYNTLSGMFNGELSHPETINNLNFEYFEDIFAVYRWVCARHLDLRFGRSMYKLFCRSFTMYLVNTSIETHKKLVRFSQLDKRMDDPTFDRSNGLYIYTYERDQIIPTIKRLYAIIRRSIDKYDCDMPKKMVSLKKIIEANKTQAFVKNFLGRIKIEAKDEDSYSFYDYFEEEEDKAEKKNDKEKNNDNEPPKDDHNDNGEEKSEHQSGDDQKDE